MSLPVSAEADSVRSVAGQVLRAMGARNINAPTPTEVRGRTSASWRSWGEDIAVHLDPDESGTGLRVRVESQSVLRFVQVDWGKNASNERRFYSLFRDAMEAYAPGSVTWPPSARRDGGIPI